MKRHPAPEKDADAVDKIEEFFKVSFGKIEDAVKKEIREFKEKRRMPEDDEHRVFSYLDAFLKDKNVATVSPSSKVVQKEVIKALSLKGGETVVEYGPADGVLTKPILAALGPTGKVIAIEKNPDFHAILGKKVADPRLITVQGDVREVKEILEAQGIDQVDRVVSGIPFTFLKPYERGRLLQATREVLVPNGRFVAYQFTTTLMNTLELFFPKVKVDFVVRNIPPLFLFTCHKG
jgi:phospholipid N-methyltransferase